VTRSTPTLDASKDVVVSMEHPLVASPRRRISPITKTLVASIMFAGVYAAFQRIGTTANADVVEYTRNLSGGFLAVGMTEDQPGFIALSALDQDVVDVNAAQTRNNLAGTHTIVEVQTPHGTNRVRLRGPQVILVTDRGAVESFNVDWTVNEFNALREAADCSHESAIKKRRCGQPFADLQEAFAKWPRRRVPDSVRNFLEPFTDRRLRKQKDD